jgi:dihydroflavonol-4-reductase
MAECVLLTGASGFIAKHILLKLLAAGHSVRATLRDPARAAEVRAAVLPQLDAEAAGRLSFATADLMRDDGWDAAMHGVTALVHTASPFPISQPKDEAELIRPAVEGTRRALLAAAQAGVGRVIVTSSIAAIVRSGATGPQDETQWADPQDRIATPYTRSKTLAERTAWEIAGATPGMRLTTINPAFVLGPPLDVTFGSSVGLVKRLLSGKDPMVPAFGLPVVDVRDVAEMHLRTLERPETAGRRYIASAGSLWMAQMGAILKAAHPARRIPSRTAPNLLMRMLALVDPEVRAVLPTLGTLDHMSNARARAEMGMDFLPEDEALRATAAALISRGLV